MRTSKLSKLSSFLHSQDEAPLRRVCRKPFTELVVETTPSDSNLVPIKMCCEKWLTEEGKALTMVVDTTSHFEILKVWNSNNFKKFRESVVDGSYRYCDTNICPIYLSEKMEEAVAPYSPVIENITFATDTSCNLACPSCRSSFNTVPNVYSEKMLYSIIQTGTKKILLNGAGEIFINKGMLRVLRTLKEEEASSMEGFTFLTNGNLLTPAMWESLSPFVRSLKQNGVAVSVDAATPETYARVRRGGNFIRVVENLLFIKELRQRGEICYFALNMTVQQDNLAEIEEFVDLALSLAVDLIYVVKIEDWSSMPSDVFTDKFKLSPTNLASAHQRMIPLKEKAASRGILLRTNL